MQSKQRGFFMQFLRLACPFWHSKNQLTIRLRTLFLVALTAGQIVIAIVITQWSAALFDALEKHSMEGFYLQIQRLLWIFIVSMAVTAIHLKIKRDLQISWRSWLTERVIGQWMTKGRHYEVTQADATGHDNPDGRIAVDIRIATEEAVGLCHSLLYSLLLLIGFTNILWTLSGTVLLDLGFIKLPIYGHLVWIALIYAGLASILGWWVGRPLTLTTIAMQNVEANFRFSLVKARENSATIAIDHEEPKEKKHFHHLFHDITSIYDIQTHAWTNLTLFSSGYTVLSMAFPILIAAPRYIIGSITLGALMQSVQVFQQLAAALSWPANNMAAIAQWRASVDRVLGLVEALDDLEPKHVHTETQ